ncbi:unnamed protein product [Darwinula stevensoni]|uniref:Uncharacterized protein n=1 Tax=Darwinula stevensoni TaxID=69355 RepID=A0A7R9AF14_9CRUS|nr:unnamed protein product [Darwinula stevensoni]CAG0902473.1 unnamed protein product [Darwinula stevensoni]
MTDREQTEEEIPSMGAGEPPPPPPPISDRRFQVNRVYSRISERASDPGDGSPTGVGTRLAFARREKKSVALAIERIAQRSLPSESHGSSRGRSRTRQTPERSRSFRLDVRRERNRIPSRRNTDGFRPLRRSKASTVARHPPSLGGHGRRGRKRCDGEQRADLAMSRTSASLAAPSLRRVPSRGPKARRDERKTREETETRPSSAVASEPKRDGIGSRCLGAGRNVRGSKTKIVVVSRNEKFHDFARFESLDDDIARRNSPFAVSVRADSGRREEDGEFRGLQNDIASIVVVVGIDLPRTSEEADAPGLTAPAIRPLGSLSGFASGMRSSTYDTRCLKSLREMTMEAFPRETHYRNMKSIQAGCQRPTLDNLHGAEYQEIPMPTPREMPDDVEQVKVKEKGLHKMGWMEGVLMPCLLNIWGVMLFLRLSWVVGQTGIGEGLVLICACNLVTIITSISMSAIATNGQIKGGGIYYMISRSLGAEFGGAIGLMFTIANAVACAMYVIGFCDSLKDLLRLEFDDTVIFDGGDNDTRIVGCATAVVILAIAAVGMKWVSKAQFALLLILTAAQVDFIVGSFMGPSSREIVAKGFVGYQGEIFAQNWRSAYGPSGVDKSDQGFFSVFGVFFPAVTGIVAGANMSGDLKDPISAIPKGTLIAVFITFLTYLGYGVMAGSCSVRMASGDPEELLDNPTSLYLHPAFNCTGRDCKWGLLQSSQMMTIMSAWGPLIYGGCFAATLSSAIASITGGPRVFQALAKDRLYPGLHFFAIGHGPNNDPFRGYIACFVVTIACILIADLNAVATLQVNFFLAAYGLINFSAFHSSFTKYPGWRPAFKFYNQWCSLFGTGFCAVVMFLIQWDVALATFAVVIILYLYVSYRRPDANWGSSTQAAVSMNALRYVQVSNQVEDHVKTYRPQVLVLAGHPSNRPSLMDFTYLLTKSSALLVSGNVVKGPIKYNERASLIQRGYAWLERHHIKGFYDVVESDRFDVGARAFFQLSGLGKLHPNMVLLGYKANWDEGDPLAALQYFNVLHDAFDNCMAVGILRLQGGLDFSDYVEEVADCSEKPEILSGCFDASLGESEAWSTSTEDREQHKKSAKKSRKSGKISYSVMYRGIGGFSLPRNILDGLTHFRQPVKKGERIDVWWLYDDGGLTILIPYILTRRRQFSSASLRVFYSHRDFSMAALLSKFRIDCSDVVVIPDVQRKAADSTRQEFNALIQPFRERAEESRTAGTYIPEAEYQKMKDKTNRQLRLRELLMEHSRDACFVVMTLPMPRKGMVSAPLYMAWLETLTRDMPPFLLVRGNQTSVLTFYS